MKSALHPAVALGLLLSTGAPVGAQPADCIEDPRECGRRAFDEGVAAFEAKDFQAALDKFREAYAIGKHPIVVYNLALAEAENGLILEALAHLDEVEANPSADAKLIDEVRTERTQMKRRLAKITVEVASARSIEVVVDGATMTATDGLYLVNPGAHRVKVVADGKVALERRIQVERGERLTLTVDRHEVVVAPARRAAPAPRVETRETDDGLPPTWFYVSAGVTAALAGVTVWSGLDTNAAKSEFDDRPPDRPRAEQQDLLDDGHAKETRTNLFLVATGVGAAATAGLGLFLVDWRGPAKPSIAIGPSGVTLHGRF